MNENYAVFFFLLENRVLAEKTITNMRADVHSANSPTTNSDSNNPNKNNRTVDMP